MVDLFLTNTQLFASQDINLWTGVVVWITLDKMFLSTVWTLILTAPIHYSGWKNKLIYILDSLSLSEFSASFHFKWTIPVRECDSQPCISGCA